MNVDTGTFNALVGERDYLRAELAAAVAGAGRLAAVVQELAEAISGPGRPVPATASQSRRERARVVADGSATTGLRVIQGGRR